MRKIILFLVNGEWIIYDYAAFCEAPHIPDDAKYYLICEVDIT